MRKEVNIMTDLLSIEEVFFERHFDYDDDFETTRKNFESALDVYFSSYYQCREFAEKISDGEVVDAPTVSLALQNLALAYKYASEFKKSLGSSEPVINIDSVDLYSISNDYLKDEGAVLVEKGMKNNEYSQLEKGRYYLFAAKNN